MMVITWNSNVYDRWEQLWNDPVVRGNNWDVICLQEVGNPQSQWEKIRGPDWGTHTNQTLQIRQYQYRTSFGQVVCITHCEWINHQKNHLAMVTRVAPSKFRVLSGDTTVRPVLGIIAQLRFPSGSHPQQMDVMIGCTHIVASSKAASEVKEMLQYIRTAAAQEHVQGWAIFGDFNVSPYTLASYVDCSIYSPGFWTQRNQSNYPIDYVIYSDPSVLRATTFSWNVGTAMSDHRLIVYQEVGGSTVQIF